MKVTNINGIKFEDYTGGEHPDVARQAQDVVLKQSERLKSKGFHRVEFDTYGGYHFRNKNRGRFVPVTTMHALRIMKK